MNASVYLFGEFNSGYSQYPDDYSSSIFQKFSANAKSTTQIAIHRDGNLVYYGYIRKLQQDRYIGLCVVLNGLILKRIDGLFSLFENTISYLVANGNLIHFSEHGELVTSVEKLYLNKEEIDILTEALRAGFNHLETYCAPLPAISFGTSKESCKDFIVDDDHNEIIKSSYTNGYTFIYKSKGYNTAQLNSYRSIVVRKDHEIKDLRSECAQLRREISSLKHKQRNTTWVSILGLIAVVLFGVLYVKVINPSEVTKKDMGEYVYYGPMANGEPNGTGVAIYHESDKDGRLYYYGNFTDGKRIDENAIMFYRDGSYFKGSMKEDKWLEGLFFDVEKEHFIGEFKNNSPWNGDWYKHVQEQSIVNGQ